MAAQPANSEILVFRTIRSYRQQLRHDSVASFIKRLRPLVMSIPGQEVLAGVLTRDTTMKDFSPYCGMAAAGAIRGFPIVFGLKPVIPFSTAVAAIDGLDFPTIIGQDAFLKNIEVSLASSAQSDLHQQARALNPTY